MLQFAPKAAAALLLLAALPAQAWADDAPAPAKPVKPRMICKTDSETGTRMAKRVCHTWEEWRKIDDATSDQAKLLLDRTANQASQAGGAAASAHP